MDFKTWTQLDAMAVQRRMSQIEARQLRVESAVRGNLVLMALLVVLLVVLSTVVGASIY